MLIRISDVTFGYEAKNILTGVSANVEEGDRIGLVGVNGAGKTTLLKLITKELLPDSGEISIKSGLSVGYLRQNAALNSEKTVFEEMMDVFAPATRAIAEMREIETRLAEVAENSVQYRELSARYAYLRDFVQAKDGYMAEIKVKTMLSGMNLAAFSERVVSTLSGGERTRLSLSKLLLSKPDLLILDEPTNHLDLPTLAFLEEFLGGYKGAILVVSHDRYFLDKITNRIFELSDGELFPFPGNYTKYKLLKAERDLSASREYEKQQEQMRKMKEYAEKNIVRATTSKSAKSRLHQLENFEILEKPKEEKRPPVFRFTFHTESMKQVFTAVNYDLSVEGKHLSGPFSFEIKRGDRVAIIGKNGTGKSTLIKRMVAGDIPRGGGVTVGYFDQENSDLNPNATVLDELWGKNHLFSATEVRNILGRMLFSDDDVEKKVSALSGGERAKLEFALVQARHANTLLLDEPTNHLDLASREALEKAVKEFTGTAVFVSHDRYFINAVATRVFLLTENSLTEYTGGYDDYLTQVAEEKKKAEENEANSIAANAAIAKKPLSERKFEAFRSKKDRAEEAKVKARIKEVEAAISALEQEETALGAEISTPEVASDYALLEQKCNRLNAISAETDRLMTEWETLLEKLQG